MKSLIIAAMLISGTAIASCPTAELMEGNFYSQGKDMTLVITRLEVDGQKTENLNVKFCKGKTVKVNECILAVPVRLYTCSSSTDVFAYKEASGYSEYILINDQNLDEVLRTQGIWPASQAWTRL